MVKNGLVDVTGINFGSFDKSDSFVHAEVSGVIFVKTSKKLFVDKLA